jgi:hypothetical protein
MSLGSPLPMSMLALHRKWECPLILFAALLWVPGAGGDAFLSDDIDHLTTWGIPPFSQVWQWFSTEYFHYYRPLTALLWNLEHAVWGLDPLGYQLANFAMHTGCALLVRELALQVFPSKHRIGLVAALLFLFLPGHIFGVLMVSALTGLLCALFYLASTVCYLRGRAGSIPARILGPLFFLLALLTKELALALPLLVVLWEAIALRSECRFTLLKWVAACWPYGLVLACYLLLRFELFGQMPYSPLHANITSVRLLINGATYLAKSLAPWGLEDLKPFFRTWPLLLALVASGGLILGAGVLWHWRRVLTLGHIFGLAFFGIAVLPVMSLYSPWNTYLPSAGIALILGATLDWGGQRTKWRLKQIILTAFLVLSIIYSLGHQRHWLEARRLGSQLTTAVSQLEETGPIYLANLPAEWDEVPLFISGWALRGALRFQGQNREIIAIANIIKAHRAEHLVTYVLDDRRFAMHLPDADEFFRLEPMEILSGARPLEIGYSYSKAGGVIRVTGLSEQGQANALEIDMGSESRLAKVYIWDGEQLKPLVGR